MQQRRSVAVYATRVGYSFRRHDHPYRCIRGGSQALARQPARSGRGGARLPLAGASEVQLGEGLVRRARPRQPARRAQDRPRRRRDARGERVVRRAVRPQHARGALPARSRRGQGRPHPHDAAEHAAALGDDACGDEDRRGDHPGDDAALRRRPRRPHLARQREACGGRTGRGREAVGLREPESQARRRRRREGLDAVRRRPRRARAAHRARADRAGRSAAALLHLGHHREAEARAAHAPELPGRPPLDHVLDRPARG